MQTNTNGRAAVVSSGRPPGTPTLPAPVVLAQQAGRGPTRPVRYGPRLLRLHNAPAPAVACATCLQPHKPGQPCWPMCQVCGKAYPPGVAVHCTAQPLHVRTYMPTGPAVRTAPAGPMPYVAPGSRAPRLRGTQVPNRTLRRPMVAKAPKGAPAPPHMAKGSIAPANRH